MKRVRLVFHKPDGRMTIKYLDMPNDFQLVHVIEQEREAFENE